MTEGETMDRKATGRIMAASLAVVAFGCGSSTPTLSRAEFVRRANASCQQARTEFATLARNANRTHASASSGRAQFAKLLHDEENALRALHPPDNLKGTYDQFVAARSAEFDAMLRFAKGDRSALLDQEHTTHRAVALASRLGLPDC
jgi:hypothetical protein